MALAIPQVVSSAGLLSRSKLSRSTRSFVRKAGLSTSISPSLRTDVRGRHAVTYVLEQDRPTLEQEPVAAEQELVEEVVVVEDDQGLGPKYNIFMSEVVAQKKRPFFFREWVSKDIQYGVYMAIVHGLCFFAPATFSWSAFGCFGVLYIITGMCRSSHRMIPLLIVSSSPLMDVRRSFSLNITLYLSLGVV